MGRDGRLPRGDPARQGDPGARRRGLPQDPQHAAVPRRQPLRLRPGRDAVPVERCWRWTGYALGALRRPRGACSGRCTRPTTSRPSSRPSTRSPRSTCSAFYVDVSKDRLYTFGARSTARRSAQTAMYVMADGLVACWPILPVTADELWRALPGHARGLGAPGRFPDGSRRYELSIWPAWQRLTAVREQVNGAIELVRQQKRVGTSLEAHVHLRARGELFALLDRYRDDLPMLFIVSRCPSNGATARAASSTVTVRRMEGERAAAGGTCHRGIGRGARGPLRSLCRGRGRAGRRGIPGRTGMSSWHWLRRQDTCVVAALVVADQATKAAIDRRCPCTRRSRSSPACST